MAAARDLREIGLAEQGRARAFSLWRGAACDIRLATMMLCRTGGTQDG